MKLRDWIVPVLAAVIVVVMFGTLTTWLLHPERFEVPPEPAPGFGADARSAPVVRRVKPRLTLAPELIPIQEAYERDRNREVVTRVDELTDPPVAALMLKAWALYKQGLADRALAVFDEILARQSAHPDALTGAGYCELRLKREAQAQARFEAALDVDPTREDTLFGLGYAHFRQGDRERAMRFLELGLERDPGNVEAREVLEDLRAKPATESEPAA